MILTIPGPPIAKARPKFARRGKFVTTYNPQESQEGKWITIAMSQIDQPPIEGPITLSCRFAMPIPKSASKKIQGAMKSGQIRHTKRPDLDNLLKFIKDCLNGIAWKDDSQVVRIVAYKHYHTNPVTWIWIKPLETADAILATSEV